ncbi:hypothetical protein K443DRAFT_639095 [Laccaria amethystina LaAM-08-1]|uniref:Uncharacterized protein n=1 Tax=Laccaria amethystina LaAM-08-1 TaxID=1095629 RepID=A0A0C9XBW1_9AGAR|nr:hypothetical protein K443DRAFT_639095 [Laccaria amethystina LaAM-08-1]
MLYRTSSAFSIGPISSEKRYGLCQVDPLYTQSINPALPVSSTHPIVILLLFTGTGIGERFLTMSNFFISEVFVWS